MKKTILIAEDEMRMRILVSDFLVMEGYDIVEAENGRQAIDIFMKNPHIHLVILDVMMPFYDGWEVCSEIRKISNVPIMMLTAKNTEPDELNGFRYGADEYVTKPFSPTIFVARVNALIKRTYGDEDTTEINKGCLTIDVKQHKVIINGTSIELSQTEYSLLLYMIDNEGQVLSRDQLLNNVWGYDYEGTDRTVDTHINRLRIKLKDCGPYIQTIRGYGYRFEVVV